MHTSQILRELRFLFAQKEKIRPGMARQDPTILLTIINAPFCCLIHRLTFHDDRIQTWALEEARRRLENEGVSNLLTCAPSERRE